MLSIQGAACASVGGVAVIVGVLTGMPWGRAYALFMPAVAAAAWPLKLYYAPERVLERKFATWDRWVERGMLTRRQGDEWKRELRAWYAAEMKVRLPSQSPEAEGGAPALAPDATGKAP